MPSRMHLGFRQARPGRRYRVKTWPYLVSHHAAALLSWAETHGRQFPWRTEREPFAVLVAEILLRKTSAQHVLKVFPTLISRYPKPADLTAADPNELRHLLQPLGMVSHRVQALQDMAKFIVDRYAGNVPTDPAVLTQIRHIGPYIANAVACFAFGLQLPIVDTNVVRVLDRFTGRRAPGARSYTHPMTWRRAGRSLPEKDVALFNYGILDLAAKVCRAEPCCNECPLRPGCATGRASAVTP